MIFKSKIVKWVLSSFLVLSVQSCSDFLKGKAQKAKNIEIQSKKLECTEKISSQVQLYMNAKAEESDINSTFLCVDEALNYFKLKVEGKEQKDAFNSEEVHLILSQFVQRAGVSLEGVKELFKLKRALVGGSDAVLTKTEISSLQNLLTDLKREVVLLKPYTPLLKLDAKSKVNKLELRQGITQINKSLKFLFKKSQLSKSEYTFEDFKRLLLNLDILTRNQNQIIELAEKVKNLLIGLNIIKSQEDYFLAIDNLTEVFKIYLTLVNNHVAFKIEDKIQIEQVMTLAQESLHLLENSVQFKKIGRLRTIYIDQIIEELIQLDSLKLDVSADILKSFYKTIIINVFSAQKTNSDISFDEIKYEHFALIKQELALFEIFLDFANSFNYAQNTGRVQLETIQSKLKNYEPVMSSKYILDRFEISQKKSILEGFNQIKSEMLGSRPVIYRFKKMVIAPNQEIWDQSWEDLVRGVYGKMLSRELLRGWGNGTEITEAGFIKWYKDFRDFAVSLKIFDKRSISEVTGRETFLQANLFTYDANGDQSLNFKETNQYISMLFSGGTRTLSEIKEGSFKAGCTLPEKDVFDSPWLEETCFKNDLKNNFKYYFSNLSYLVQFVSQMNQQQFDQYYDLLITVARFDSSIQNKVETADLRTLSLTLMFIESLFAITDLDKNWTLSSDEIRKAYPQFQNFVTNYARKSASESLNAWNTYFNPCNRIYTEQKFIKEAFVFLVYNGTMPTKADVDKSLKSLASCSFLGQNSNYKPFNFQGEVDRKTIINTFKVLKTALSSKDVKNSQK